VSMDEGLSWDTVSLGAKPFVSEGVIAPKEGVSLKFLIVGTREGVGVTVLLDLEAMHLRKCTGKDKAGDPSSDYEKWNLRAPSALLSHTREQHATAAAKLHTTEDCLFGRRIFYVRRKQARQCFNGMSHEHRSAQELCECIDSDFECDYGFKSEPGSLECKWDPENLSGDEVARVQDMVKLHKNQALSHEMCNRHAGGAADHELVSVTGYRHIPGDFCVGGKDKGGIVVVCAAPLINTRHGVIVLLMLLATGICGVGYLLYSNYGPEGNKYEGYHHQGYRRPQQEADAWENVGLFAGGDDYTEEY